MKKITFLLTILTTALIFAGCGKSAREKLDEAYEKFEEADNSGSEADMEKAIAAIDKAEKEYEKELEKAERINLTLKVVGADTLDEPDTIEIRLDYTYTASELVAEFQTDECQTYDFEGVVGESSAWIEGEKLVWFSPELTLDDDGRVIIVDYEKGEIYFEDEAEQD